MVIPIPLLTGLLGNFFSYIRLNLTVQEIENTKYINDTARSMLCHINPAAYTYKGSFTLYATPQKGREGHLNFVVVIAKPIWGHGNSNHPYYFNHSVFGTYE